LLESDKKSAWEMLMEKKLLSKATHRIGSKSSKKKAYKHKRKMTFL
jgi:hypothetical protein